MYDQGEYICVAENLVGRVDAAANIVVVPDPNNRRYLLLSALCKEKQPKTLDVLTYLFQGRGKERRLGQAKYIFFQVQG